MILEDYGPDTILTGDAQNLAIYNKDLAGYVLVDVNFAALRTSSSYSDTYTLTTPKGNLIPNFEGYETNDGFGRTRYHLVVARNKSTSTLDAMNCFSIWTDKPIRFPFDSRLILNPRAKFRFDYDFLKLYRERISSLWNAIPCDFLARQNILFNANRREFAALPVRRQSLVRPSWKILAKNLFTKELTMTKRESAAKIATKLETSHQETLRIVQGTFDAIIETLVVEGRIELRNFGVFEVKRRAARLARNPKTGEKVKVPKKCVVVFKPARKWKKKSPNWSRRKRR